MILIQELNNIIPVNNPPIINKIINIIKQKYLILIYFNLSSSKMHREIRIKVERIIEIEFCTIK